MLNLSDSTRNKVFYAGLGLVLAGGALFYWALQHFDALTNYQRLASLVPLVSAGAMLEVDSFRNWRAIGPTAKGRAIVALVAPALLLVAATLWWLVSPDARA